MADQVIILPTDSTGKKVDTSELTVGANTVERQRVNISDPTTAAAHAAVMNSQPAGTEYGVVVREAQKGQQTSASSIPTVLASDQSVIPVGGSVADGTADSGNSIKAGGKVTLNSASLPTALTANQRGPVMIDEYGRVRVVENRPKIVGNYKFESGRLTVLASAHGSTAGFFWLINPVGSAVVGYVKKLFATSVPTAVTAFASSPRVTVERMTFTGTASGASITPAKRDSNDATNTLTLRTASTGLTITAGAVLADFTVPAVLTAVGIAVPVDQWFYDASDEDDYVVLRAGEGLVFRQPDAGTTSDTRLLLTFGSWEER